MAVKVQISRKFSRLTNKDFTILANQSNYESEIATYQVPPKKVFEIPDAFIGMKLMTKESFSFTTATGETSHDCTLTYPIAQDSTIALKGANVIVVKRSPTPAGEWSTANYTVTLPKTVTLSGLTQSTSYVFDIFYLFGGAGSVNITIYSDDRSAKTKILESAIRKINQVNQEDVRTGIKPGQVGLVIPERYLIQVRVICPASIVLWDPIADSGAKSLYARESFIELPVNVSDLLAWPEGIKAFAKSQLIA
jgi:hypothetical protein